MPNCRKAAATAADTFSSSVVRMRGAAPNSARVMRAVCEFVRRTCEPIGVCIQWNHPLRRGSRCCGGGQRQVRDRRERGKAPAARRSAIVPSSLPLEAPLPGGWRSSLQVLAKRRHSLVELTEYDVRAVTAQDLGPGHRGEAPISSHDKLTRLEGGSPGFVPGIPPPSTAGWLMPSLHPKCSRSVGSA